MTVKLLKKDSLWLYYRVLQRDLLAPQSRGCRYNLTLILQWNKKIWNACIVNWVIPPNRPRIFFYLYMLHSSFIYLPMMYRPYNKSYTRVCEQYSLHQCILSVTNLTPLIPSELQWPHWPTNQKAQKSAWYRIKRFVSQAI